MSKKVIGILGGMGPLATADLFQKITLHTVAACDQAHPRVCIDSNTDIADRTAALLHGGEDPVPEMIKSAKRLESIGADFLIMPCNTAHNYYEQVCEAVTIPVLHMIALTRDALKARGVKCAGLLATDGTVQTGIYQRTFEQSGVELLTPDSAADQAAVMDVIYNGVKAGDLTHDVAAFRAACEHLLARGAEVLILGCTELPPAFELYHLDYPNVDPTLELALGAIRAAGCENQINVQDPAARSAPPYRLSLRCAAGRRCFFMDERKLLIADDSELNRAILVSVLEKDFDILEAADGKEAIATLAAHEGNIAALLLDVVMPEADGFEVLEEMNRRGWIDEIPTIMISVETGGSYIDRAFQLGAADYVSRPFVPNMIRRRVINAILLHTKTRKLTGLIADRFYRRERNTDILTAILGYAVEFRSGERGTHMTNVSRITGLLLHRLLERTDRCPIGPEDIETVCIASSLHDIGKLLIPEDILTKPTALTPGEFDIVKQHTRLGAKIISDLPIYQNETIIKYALEICRWHHERWNGEGYPDGLKGEDIPIAAQVVSLADAYDALTSKRCYKEALSHEKSLEMIRGGECGSFNPLLLECLNDIADTLKHSAENRGRRGAACVPLGEGAAFGSRTTVGRSSPLRA